MGQENRAQVLGDKCSRLRGHPVHSDILTFWRELLAHARATKPEQLAEKKAAQEQLMATLDA
jgi:hypothetical protein